MIRLSTQDRNSLIRLASSLPKGDETRRAILSGLKISASSEGRGILYVDGPEDRTVWKKNVSDQEARGLIEKWEKDFEEWEEEGLDDDTPLGRRMVKHPMGEGADVVLVVGEEEFRYEGGNWKKTGAMKKASVFSFTEPSLRAILEEFEARGYPLVSYYRPDYLLYSPRKARALFRDLASSAEMVEVRGGYVLYRFPGVSIVKTKEFIEQDINGDRTVLNFYRPGGSSILDTSLLT